MNRSLLWRGLTIVAVAAIVLLSALPLEENIKLGLDLRGGIHLKLEVATEDALRSETDKDLERLLAELSDNGVSTASGDRLDDSSFVVRGVTSANDDDVRTIVDDFLPGWNYQRSGDELTFRMETTNRNTITNLAVVQAVETIRNRVDAFGVAEPVIQRQGAKRVVVELPGVDDPERVKELIGTPAFLEFRLVDYPLRGAGAISEGDVLANYGGVLPANLEMKTQIARDDDGQETGRFYYAVEKRAAITGRDLRNARPGLGDFNQPVVNFFLTHEGGQRFGELTGNNVGKGLAIVLDGFVVSAPNINSRINDQGIIEGGFTQREVEDLSTVLRSGALPAGISYLEERTVGPSLGQDSIRRGLRAGLLGLGLIILLMVVIYKVTGFNAVLALVLNIAVIFGALAYFDATLTLPGIAGIVLIIGMAVDANVLVFERIREELRKGRTVKSSIDAGFAKALSSVLDANITTLIAALFLFQFGTGPIRGFAVTLSIGILASVFTAIFVSRWIFDLVISRRRKVDRLSI